MFIPKLPGKVRLTMFSISVILCLSACTSDDQTVKDIDTKLEAKGQVGMERIGLNDDGQAIIQRTDRADNKLADLIYGNNDLESEIKYLYHEIQRCRRDLADQRLGGNGEIIPLPPLNAGQATPSSEELGLNEQGELVILQRTPFTDRLKNEQEKNDHLKALIPKIRDMKYKCEFRMGQARVKAGLPAERYQGKIEVDSGGSVRKIIKTHEKNLDDAFRILEIRQKMELSDPQD
ncbi:MAG: hypothetical protein H6618_08015 [Deltaproteobacteria bacterium]|nr:hypothetical protein [Deltaproteobacteria bacterium]